MSRIILSYLFIVFSLGGISQRYKPTDNKSKVHFIIKNFGIETGGDLSGLAGDIDFIPGNPSACKFSVSVNVNTIDTDNGTRDNHLKGKEYFGAEKFPVITITSVKINRTNKTSSGWYFFTGTLSMHGITKPISFPFTAILKGNDYLFTGGFTINRLDFGIGKTSSVLSNTVKISLSVVAGKS